MQKTELMKRYEAETGSEAIDYLTEYPDEVFIFRKDIFQKSFNFLLTSIRI